MIHVSAQALRGMLQVCTYLLLATMFAAPSLAQDKGHGQTAGVDNTKMGAYRALAQLSFQAFQKGDNATAAELARILDRTWDRGEGQERQAGKPNRDLYNQIDEAMDGFIDPLMNYAAKAPDASKVQAAYNNYLEKLKLAD